MADRATYLQLLEHGQQINFLLDSPELEEDEKKELIYIWDSLKSREESKFDAIIGVIKECDKQINNLENEIDALKVNQEHWKKKRVNYEYYKTNKKCKTNENCELVKLENPIIEAIICVIVVTVVIQQELNWLGANFILFSDFQTNKLRNFGFSM